MPPIFYDGIACNDVYFNGVKTTGFLDGHQIWGSEEPHLPPFTVRFKANKAITTSDFYSTVSSTIELTLVDDSEHIYDVASTNGSFSDLFYAAAWLLEVIDANSSNVTNMSFMFSFCSALTTAQLFDTSSVTNMSYMFHNCNVLTSVPLFNTSSVTNMSNMFNNCYKVESGALALYTQASAQANPPASHTSTFRNCGRDTATGAAELAQIPSDWK